MGLAREGLGPEKPLRGFKTQVRESSIIGAPHLTIDLDEAGHGVAGAIGIELVDDLIEEGVADLEIVHGVVRLLFLWELHNDGLGYIVAGADGGVNQRRRSLRHVPSEGEERKRTGLATGHGPAAIGLIADLHSG